jgi:hypothetical protein
MLYYYTDILYSTVELINYLTDMLYYYTDIPTLLFLFSTKLICYTSRYAHSIKMVYSTAYVIWHTSILIQLKDMLTDIHLIICKGSCFVVTELRAHRLVRRYVNISVPCKYNRYLTFFHITHYLGSLCANWSRLRAWMVKTVSWWKWTINQLALRAG